MFKKLIELLLYKTKTGRKVLLDIVIDKVEKLMTNESNKFSSKETRKGKAKGKPGKKGKSFSKANRK